MKSNKFFSFILGFLPSAIVTNNYGLADDYSQLTFPLKRIAFGALANGRPIGFITGPLQAIIVHQIKLMWVLHLLSAILSGLFCFIMFQIFCEIKLASHNSLLLTAAITGTPGMLFTFVWSAMIPCMFGYIIAVLAVLRVLKNKADFTAGLLLAIAFLAYQPSIAFAMVVYFLCHLLGKSVEVPQIKEILLPIVLPIIFSFLISYLLLVHYSNVLSLTPRANLGSLSSKLSYIWNYDFSTSLNLLNPLGVFPLLQMIIALLAVGGIMILAKKHFSLTVFSIGACLFSAYFLCLFTQEYASNRSLTAAQGLFAVLAMLPIMSIFEKILIKYRFNLFFTLTLILIVTSHSVDVLVQDFYKPNMQELKIVQAALTFKKCSTLQYVIPSNYETPITGPTYYDFGATTTQSWWGAIGIANAACRNVGRNTNVSVYETPEDISKSINFQLLMHP